MSEENKILDAIQKSSDKLNDFIKSSGAEVKAAKDGVETVKADVAAIRKQHQELAELVKAGVPKKDREICGELGKIIVKAASGGTDATGGYTVNDELTTFIKSVQNQYGVVRRLFGSSIYPMQSDVTKVPVDTFEDTTANAPVPTATNENAQISASNDAQLDQLTLTASKYATLNYISNELVDDSFVDFIGAYLLPKIGRKAARIEDQIVLSTASTGLFNTSNVQVVNMKAGETSFNNLNFDHLLDLEDAVVDDALENGMYLGHRTILNVLRKIKGNDGQYLYAPAVAGEAATIRGYGFERAQVAPAISSSAVSTGFLLFGDITKGCMVGERNERRIAVSDDFKFDYDQKAVRMTFRFAFATNANIGRAISVLKTAAA